MFFGEGTCAAVSAEGADDVMAALRAAYGPVALQAENTVSYRQRVVRDRRFAVAETTLRGKLALQSGRLPYLAVVDLPAGRSQFVETGSSRWVRSDSTPFLFPLRPKHVVWRDVRVRQLVLDEAAVNLVLAEQGLPPVQQLRLQSAPTTATGLQRWTAAAAHARTYAASAAFIDSPLSRTAVFGLLVAALVDAFADQHNPQPEPLAAPAAGRGAVEEALEYIREHAAEDMPVSVIAAAAGVSVRALQRAFASQLGQRPLEAVRAERLRRARRDLLRAAPDSGITVRAVAARWGFTNPGRFAASYTATHGHPSAADLHR